VTVRRATSQLDTWDVLPGETRWVDYSCQQEGGDLVVYLHAFRRVRDRFDADRDVLFWKPSTTRVAHRYPADEWADVVRDQQEWPPVGVQQVPRRR
jgi:hypothetical protein